MVQEEGLDLKGDIEFHRVPRRIDPGSVVNPNKAVMTLNASGKILTVNDMTTLLLGSDLLNNHNTIFDLLPYATDVASVEENLNKGKGYQTPAEADTNKEPDLKVAAEEDVVESEGIVVFSGNVVTIETDDMGEMPVSLWMKELPVDSEEESRWIAVIEPITTTVSKIKIDKEGLIMNKDEKFNIIFGSEVAVDNDNLFNYISLTKLPDDKTEQEYIDQPCTACNGDREALPLCVTILPCKNGVSTIPEGESCFDVKIKLFSNISGLMIVDEKCIIRQYNHNFTRLLFGYGSKDLEGENISRILPDFQDISCLWEVKKKFFCDDLTKDENGSRESPKDSSIPYIDESLKENEMETKNETENFDSGDRLKSSMCVSDRNANSEGSTFGTPNRGFVVSDSQFTLSSINFQKSTSTNVTSNPSFNQTISKERVSETTPVPGSPVQNANFSPSNVMKDITNSLNVFNITEQPDQTRFPLNLSLVTSTPALCKQKESLRIQEGSYFCAAKHKDGSSISVLYQIRRMFLNGRDQFCIWVTWDPSDSTMDESKPRNQSNSSGTPNKSFGSVVIKDFSDKSADNASLFTPVDVSDTTLKRHKFDSSFGHDSDDEETTRSITRTDGSSANEYSLSQSITEFKPRSFSENDMFLHSKGSKHTKSNTFEEPVWVLTNGDYSDHYTVLRQIGKGAFGYVRLSYRIDDGLIVVTKFIKKSQVYKDSWTEDPITGEKVCLEVDLLMKLDHPNIVKAFTYFENDKYFQLVMEKWGSGMDLFEFIDRGPSLDEPLTSYIFRQIVSPLIYLRSLNIIHRDIKDENIIINHKFQIKLIDFGSAAYLKEDKKFSQFAGTIEYCSPEVLKGQKYCGPELEIWSLGITLYTLIFGENPFSTVNQVLREPLTISDSYSDDLFVLLCGMLKKTPAERMNLDDIWNHSWTNQEVDLDMYAFEDVVPCDNEDLSPVKYINDVSLNDESLSTTSSSFVYEERQSHSATETTFNQSPKSATALAPHSDDAGKQSHNATASSSRSSTSQSVSSYKSSVTIDSSIFFASPRNKARNDTCSSSFSDVTDASYSVNSQTQSISSESHLQRSHRSSESLNSLTSLSSSNSNTSSRSSTCSDTSVTSMDSDDTISSSEENESSNSSTGTSSSSSSFVSQETVSVDSCSDDDTLANTFTNVLALDKEEEEEE